MKVAIVFEPDPDLGHDPLDETEEPRRLGIFIDSMTEDVLLMHRRYGDQFSDGYRTDIYASGIWENVTVEQVEQAMGIIEALPEE